MQRFSVEIDVFENDDGPFVEYDEAREDVKWLVSLIKNRRIEGSDDEYEDFDELCDRWNI
jgi:hypothetical protein